MAAEEQRVPPEPQEAPARVQDSKDPKMHTESNAECWLCGELTQERIDVGQLYARVGAITGGSAGAIASFVGLPRTPSRGGWCWMLCALLL